MEKPTVLTRGLIPVPLMPSCHTKQCLHWASPEMMRSLSAFICVLSKNPLSSRSEALRSRPEMLPERTRCNGTTTDETQVSQHKHGLDPPKRRQVL